VTIQKDKASPSPSSGTSGLSAEDMQALKQFSQQFQASGGASGTGRVFMGMNSLKKPKAGQMAPLGGWIQGPPPPMPGAQPDWEPGPRSAPTPKWMTTDQATNQYFNWTQKQRDDFRAKGLLSGLLTQGAGDMEAYGLWSSLVKQSALYGAQGKQVSPMDILSGYVKANSSGGWIKDGDFEVNPVTGERRYVGPRFKTTTQTNTNFTDPATARAIATTMFQQLLGRDPGKGEIGQYASALAASERDNPSTTTTTTEYDPTTGEPIGSNSTTTGGLTDEGRSLLASDEIKDKAEYGATQAATTYMQALQQAVGSGG
jgi:hypothetical protein